jgi:CRP-like cAMP-binding protein
MIFNGTVDIEVSGKKVNQLKDGQFVGEMSYLTNKPASANVKACFDTEYISWKHEDLKELMKRNPSLIFSLQSAMGLQLSNVLIANNKGN